MWHVRYTDEFDAWWRSLSAGEQDAILYGIGLLEKIGPALGRPHVDAVAGSQFANMKELRCQYRGRPYRVLFAFDPLRSGASVKPVLSCELKGVRHGMIRQPCSPPGVLSE